MIFSVIDFTGYRVDNVTDVLLKRRHEGVIPDDWHRVRFIVDDPSCLKKVDRWLYDNIDRRWASYIVTLDKTYMTVAFETDDDAVMFKLKNGEIAWEENNRS